MGHLLFPVIVLIIVAISKALAASGNQPESGGRPGREESPEERKRRFLEAMSLPTDSIPPPPVKPPPEPDTRPLMPVYPPGPGTGIPRVAGRLRRASSNTPPIPSRPAPAQPTPRAFPRTPPPAPPAVVPQPIAPVPVMTFAQVTSIPDFSPAGLAVSPPRAPIAPAARDTISSSVILRRLRDPASIREAIILREVLGPPKAFL